MRQALITAALLLFSSVVAAPDGPIYAGAVGPDPQTPAGRGLFISGTTAAEVTALPHYIAAVQRATSSPHNVSGSSAFIRSFVFSPITRDSGSGSGTITAGRSLHTLIPMIQAAGSGGAQIFIGTNWPSNLEHLPDTYCGQLAFNESFAAADAAASARVAATFVAQFPQLNFNWYITPENFLHYLALGCEAKAWGGKHVDGQTLSRSLGRYLHTWTSALHDVYPAAHFLWSPSCPESPMRQGISTANGSFISAAAYRARLVQGLSILLQEAPLVDTLVLQDSIGKASNVSRDGTVRYGVTAADAIFHAEAAQEAVEQVATTRGSPIARIQINMEMFLRAGHRVPSKDIVDLAADPQENQQRMAIYNAARFALGASWEMHYWNKQLELGGNWTTKCRPLPCSTNAWAPPCCRESLSTHGALGCVDDGGCSHNGQCTNGSCVCSAGWRGGDCHILQLAPAVRPAAQAYCHFNDSTWGGTVLYDKGVYHMWFSEMSNNCSLHMYGSVSRIVHATSRTPAGPFIRQAIALPTFAHNPQIIRATDGMFLLFHIGASVKPACVPDCRAGGPSSTPHCQSKGHGTSIAVAQSPYGPWERVDYVLPDFTNPSPYMFSNGTVLLAARKNGIHILRAPHWRGPYEHVLRVGEYEDPFLYRDKKGRFHMLSHDRDDHSGGSQEFFADRGGHWSSVDGLSGWSGPVEAYSTEVVWVDGVSAPLNARQRPFLFFDPVGRGTYLFNGAGLPGAKSHWNYSFTFVQALDTA